MDTITLEGTVNAVQSFLTHEAYLLDAGCYEDWLNLFSSEGIYWVPAKQSQSDPHTQVSLMYDDRLLLETRVKRLVASIAHATTPTAIASRQVTNVAILEHDGSSLVARSKFSMVEFRRNSQRIFAGTYIHRLIGVEGSFKIASKRVNLANAEAELEALVLPF